MNVWIVSVCVLTIFTQKSSNECMWLSAHVQASRSASCVKASTVNKTIKLSVFNIANPHNEDGSSQIYPNRKLTFSLMNTCYMPGNNTYQLHSYRNLLPRELIMI